MSSTNANAAGTKQEDLAECTFTPQISPYAKTFVRSEPVSKRAQQVLQEREQKLKKLAQQLEEKTKCSFKPEINKDYQFREKREPFIATINDQIKRKEEQVKKNELKKLEEPAGTFVPEISTYSKALERTEPIHERLFKMAKQIAQEPSPNQSVSQDPNLFHPHVNEISMAIVNNSPDKYKERVEDRLMKEVENRKQKLQQLEEEVQKQMTSHFQNPKSSELRRSKAEKEIDQVFKDVTKQNNKKLNYVLLGNAMKILGLFKSGTDRRSEEEVRIHEKLWKAMDPQDSGEATFDNFREIVLPIVCPDALSEFDNKIIRQLQSEIKALSVNKFAYSSKAPRRASDDHKKKIEPEKFTFKPQINPTSKELDHKHELALGPRVAWDVSEDHSVATDHHDSQSDGASTSRSLFSPRYEKLIKTKATVEKKIEKEREKIQKEELKECTFAPKVSAKAPKRNYDGLKHFEYLYSQRNKPKKLDNYVHPEEKELEQCTFKPQTNKYNKPKPVEAKQQPIKGYTAVIERMRKATKEREAMELRDSLRRPESWYKNENKVTEVKPFNFQLDKRVRARPLLYMDVNLGPGRTGRIGIHDMDNPKQLAKNFAQSYRLDPTLTKRLEELIRENMVKNSINIAEDDSMPLSARSPKSGRNESPSERLMKSLNQLQEFARQEHHLDESIVVIPEDETTVQDLNVTVEDGAQ